MAYARCALDHWVSPMLSGPSKAVIYGAGAPGPHGTAWHWTYVTNLGEHRCMSLIVEEKNRGSFLRRPRSYLPGPAPMWAISSETPFPPDIPRFSAGYTPPNVIDVAYGWPFPCIALRLESFQEADFTPEEELAIRASPLFAQAYAKVDKVCNHPPRLVMGFSCPTWLSRKAFHNGYWPSRLLWGRLLLNIAANSFLIAVPWLTLILLRGARSRLRHRRGRCAACGYGTEGLLPGSPCPECGSSRPPSARKAEI